MPQLMTKFVKNKNMYTKSPWVDLQKCITWLKKFGEGHQEWSRACIEVGLKPKKLNTLVKTKLVWFLDIKIFVPFLQVYCF
jgi:hypothetical protein